MEVVHIHPNNSMFHCNARGGLKAPVITQNLNDRPEIVCDDFLSDTLYEAFLLVSR